MTTDAMADLEIGEPSDASILGQPKGVYFLAFTEAWERFSYYGMSSLVVLYMTQALLLPGHIEHVAGMAPLRTALEGIFGPLSTQALSSQIFGYYSGLVYFTPVIGGWIADRFLGVKRSVIAGAVLMSAKTRAPRKTKDDEGDPVVAGFLQFLEQQIGRAHV